MRFFEKIIALIKDNKAQAATEYIVVTGGLLGMFIVINGPIPIIPMTIRAFQIYIDGMHVVITLPIP